MDNELVAVVGEDTVMDGGTMNAWDIAGRGFMVYGVISAGIDTFKFVRDIFSGDEEVAQVDKQLDTTATINAIVKHDESIGESIADIKNSIDDVIKENKDLKAKLQALQGSTLTPEQIQIAKLQSQLEQMAQGKIGVGTVVTDPVPTPASKAVEEAAKAQQLQANQTNELIILLSEQMKRQEEVTKRLFEGMNGINKELKSLSHTPVSPISETTTQKK
jgi:hypothetical protein